MMFVIVPEERQTIKQKGFLITLILFFGKHSSEVLTVQ